MCLFANYNCTRVDSCCLFVGTWKVSWFSRDCAIIEGGSGTSSGLPHRDTFLTVSLGWDIGMLQPANRPSRLKVMFMWCTFEYQSNGTCRSEDNIVECITSLKVTRRVDAVPLLISDADQWWAPTSIQSSPLSSYLLDTDPTYWASKTVVISRACCFMLTCSCVDVWLHSSSYSLVVPRY